MTTGISSAIRRIDNMQTPFAPGVPLAMLLWQLSSVVERLTDEQYAMKPVGVVESSIGGHLRHCLDHISALLRGLESRGLDYDHRERGTPIETDRGAAMRVMASLEARVTQLSAEDLDRPVEISVLLSSAGEPIRVTSSFGRELAYVLSHTIHHNALIGTMVKLLGGWLPDRFGYAPSTLAYMQRTTCAR